MKKRRSHQAVLIEKLARVKAVEKDNEKLKKDNPNPLALALIALNVIKIASIIKSIASRTRRK